MCRIVTFSEQTITERVPKYNIFTIKPSNHQTDYILYNLSYIILETKINFENAVTFVLVKLDTKFNLQNS